MNPTPTPSRPEDELLEQWSFLDSMVERQATSLRAGSQDPEEEGGAEPVAASASIPDELSQLRTRMATLEREADALRAQLEGRTRELQRAEQHGAELMRSLRDAHTAVEAARAQGPGTEPPQGSATLANQHPAPTPAKPSLLDRLLGRR